jgi:hypothetical protein
VVSRGFLKISKSITRQPGGYVRGGWCGCAVLTPKPVPPHWSIKWGFIAIPMVIGRKMVRFTRLGSVGMGRAMMMCYETIEIFDDFS